MFAKLKTEKLINGRMFGQTNNTAESERERERESRGRREQGSEKPDSDRDGPGLSLGLLSGRVCASLSACLSSVLLSILLKTICLLIIHPLLFWTDMFSLHQYFHHSANGLFSALSQNRRAAAGPADGLFAPGVIFQKETFFIPYTTPR